MLQRLGDVIYWTASGAAVLCVFIGVLIAVTDHLHPVAQRLDRSYCRVLCTRGPYLARR